MSKIRSFITGLVTPARKLEETLLALITQRNVSLAVGAQLTQLGTLVGRPRNGITDDDIYRRYVQAQILANRSDGQGETMYRIVRVILGDTDHTLHLVNEGDAAFTMRVEAEALEWAIAEIVIYFLRKAVSTGVRPLLEFAIDDPDLAFTFSDTDDYIDGGGIGFSDTDDYVDGPDGGMIAVLE